MRKGFGIITPTISPFRDGEIDTGAVDKLVAFARKSGVKGIFPAGSTGCAPLMDIEQHKSVIREYASAASGMKVFAGIGRNSVNETLEVSRSAIKSGVDALVLVTPYYMPIGQDEIVRYYDRLLGRIDFDVIAYSIPQLTGTAITPVAFKRIAKRHRNLIGIKDSSSDFLNFSRFCLELPDDMLVFQGEDNLLLQSLMLGASGGICGSTNFNDKAVRVFNAFRDGKKEVAGRLQGELDEIIDAASSAEIPLAYHYAFYRKVMHRSEINALPPFYRNDSASIRDLARSMARFL